MKIYVLNKKLHQSVGVVCRWEKIFIHYIFYLFSLTHTHRETVCTEQFYSDDISRMLGHIVLGGFSGRILRSVVEILLHYN